jgi:hypothetical protein
MQLTAKQTTMLDRAAALLPLADQSAFAKSIANIVNRWTFQPRDAEVRDVIRLVLAQRGVSVGDLMARPRPFAHQRQANNFRNWHQQQEKRHAHSPVLLS